MSCDHIQSSNRVPNNHNNHKNHNCTPKAALLTYRWGSVASQFLTLVGELAGEASCQPEPCTERYQVNNCIRLGHVTCTTVAVSRRPSSRWACGGGAGTLVARPGWGAVRWLRQEAAGERCGGPVVAAVVGSGRGSGGAGRAAIPGAALRFGRPCDHAATSSSSSSAMTCPSSSSSNGWWTFLLCGSFVYPQCKLCR